MTDILDALLEQNAAGRAELLDAIDALPGECCLEGWYGSDQWSVKDIIVHIARWQEGYAAALEAMAHDERPLTPGFEPNPDDPDAAVAAYNADSVAFSRGDGWEVVMRRLCEARERHDGAVLGLRVLDPDRYAVGRTAHRLADVATHDREHLPAILAWRREQNL